MTTKPGHPDTHGHYPGDPDEKSCQLCNPPEHYYVGTNKPKVEHIKDPIADYTGLNTTNWTDSDNDARSPLEADLEDGFEPLESDIE